VEKLKGTAGNEAYQYGSDSKASIARFAFDFRTRSLGLARLEIIKDCAEKASAALSNPPGDAKRHPQTLGIKMQISPVSKTRANWFYHEKLYKL